MKSRDITQTPIFRKYGAKGMRRYSIVWGAFMYLFLIFVSGSGFYGLMQIINEPGLRILLFVAIALIVAAASLLTKMLIGIFNELLASESQQKADSENN
jgi:hypothetical protein